MAKLLLLAGANGAGKTTFAEAVLPRELASGRLLNAERIADARGAGRNESALARAGREVLTTRQRFIATRTDFAVETTLSGQGLLRDLTRAKRQDFRIELHYLFAPTALLCLHRIALRIQAGGESLPWEVVQRRHRRGLAALPAVLALVDRAFLWDVSALPRLMGERAGGRFTVYDEAAWQRLESAITAAEEG